MKPYFYLLVLTLVPWPGVKKAGAQERAHATLPTVAALAGNFRNPPAPYGPTVTWGWEGPVDSTVIDRDLDRLRSLGFRMVTIEGGYRMTYPYLSPGYFKLIRYAVEGAKKRGMRVWIIDEGKYPSGFAGGLFSQKRPDLRMQALVAGERIPVPAGQSVTRKTAPGVISAVAYNADTSVAVPLQDGAVTWKAPEDQGDWTLLTVAHEFRTSPTRAANSLTGAKDTKNSLCDYLNPAAARQFIQFTHAQYKKYIGDEFGKTVMGFRSDEPAYSYTPWTPDMAARFKKQKGYDITPFLASFFLRHPTEKQRLAKADYWEVFSNLFRDHFFKIISGWCRANHLLYEDHIDHDGPEDNATMLALGRSEGDYFRDMRYLQIPGIDVIWHQLWPGEENNFPKLASSAAHLFGRSQVFSESFAAFRPAPDISQVRWILNEQLVRGINLFEIMFYSASTRAGAGPRGFMASDSFPATMEALSRKSYVLSQGRPAAKIGIFFPTGSLWLRDTTANQATWRLATQLLDHQLDFDFLDFQSLTSLMKVQGGRFVNLSGQAYRVVLVPPVEMLPDSVFKRLRSFAAQGGKVVFMGGGPAMLRGKSFLDRFPAGDLSWAVRETGDTVSAPVLDSLPADVQFDRPLAAIKYVHRQLADGDLYFFFNASAHREARTVTLKGRGEVQAWNADKGTIIPVNSSYIRDGFAKIPLDMAPGESRIIVLGKVPGKFLAAYYQSTTRENTPHAVSMAWPGAQAVITSLSKKKIPSKTVSRVVSSGTNKRFQYHLTDKGLLVRTPGEKPGPYPYLFSITGLKLL